VLFDEGSAGGGFDSVVEGGKRGAEDGTRSVKSARFHCSCASLALGAESCRSFDMLGSANCAACRGACWTGSCSRHSTALENDPAPSKLMAAWSFDDCCDGSYDSDCRGVDSGLQPAAPSFFACSPNKFAELLVFVFASHLGLSLDRGLYPHIHGNNVPDVYACNFW